MSKLADREGSVNVKDRASRQVFLSALLSGLVMGAAISVGGNSGPLVSVSLIITLVGIFAVVGVLVPEPRDDHKAFRTWFPLAVFSGLGLMYVLWGLLGPQGS